MADNDQSLSGGYSPGFRWAMTPAEVASIAACFDAPSETEPLAAVAENVVIPNIDVTASNGNHQSRGVL